MSHQLVVAVVAKVIDDSGQQAQKKPGWEGQEESGLDSESATKEW